MGRRRHLVMFEATMWKPGKTRCGRPVPYNPGIGSNGQQYRMTLKRVNCQNCIRWSETDYNNRRYRRWKRGQVATIRDGKRIPYSSLRALERPLEQQNETNGPSPGPPYPWEIAAE